MAVRLSLNQWTLRDVVLTATHRWYIILAFILAGALIAVLVAFAWPSPYRATADIYVGLNAYRAAEDQYVDSYANFNFTNLDDYKHWQMSQLSLLILTDDYLGETLSRLQAEDAYWSQVDIPSLRKMLHAYWRNAGQWRLVVQNRDPNRAEQAVQAWRTVIFEKTSSAITTSRELFNLDLQIKEITKQQIETKTRQEDLVNIENYLSGWADKLSNLPPSETLTVAERWRLYALVASAANLGPEWRSLLGGIPPENADGAAYLPWLSQVLPAVDQEIADQKTHLQDLDKEHSEAMAKWDAAVEAGHGLSATLIVEAPSNAPAQISAERPVSAAMIIGGLLGLIAWGIYTLARIARGVRA